MSGKITAHVALLTFDLMIPFSQSLKSKRRVIRSLKDRTRSRFNASIAEIDYLDEWQRSLIGITMISNDRQHLERGFSAINRLVEDISEIELLQVRVEWL